MTSHDEAADFDRLISYEDIAVFLAETDRSPRGQYRSAFIATAATRRQNSWTREQDDATDAFWDKAYRLAARDFPILEMKRLTLTKGSKWITCRPHDMPTQPKHVYVSLKGDRGFIDLTFGDTIAHQFASEIGHLLVEEMSIHQTSRSAAIRIEAPAFTVADGPAVSLPKLRAAFGASQS